MENQYKWGDKQPDGSTTLLKNGKPTACPRATLIFLPSTIEGQAYPFRSACCKECPFMMAAMLRKDANDEGKPGYTINCMDRPLAIFVDEAEIKSKLKLLK